MTIYFLNAQKQFLNVCTYFYFIFIFNYFIGIVLVVFPCTFYYNIKIACFSSLQGSHFCKIRLIVMAFEYTVKRYAA